MGVQNTTCAAAGMIHDGAMGYARSSFVSGPSITMMPAALLALILLMMAARLIA